jgi:hypothetical protein
MAWQDQLKSNSLPWLLEPESPGVRYLALRDLVESPPAGAALRAARKAAHQEGPIAAVLNAMDEAGFWARPGPGYNPKYRSTDWSLILLGQLGAVAAEDKRIAQACAYLLEHGLSENGQFTTNGAPSGTVDCLQGNLCWALLELGYEDPRLDAAYAWMARSTTGEGIAPADDRDAPLRYYAYKSGPVFACGVNAQQPCAWGGVKVLLALAHWPKKRRTPLMRRAIGQGVDFFFSIDPATASYPSRLEGKPNRAWWKFGFPVFYVTDLLQMAEALVALGYGKDPRLAHTLTLIREKQDENGRWALDYDYPGKTWVDFGEKRQPNKWVTLRALRVLKAAGAG